ncbi:hypothetical protein scyTo_0021709 [Scyliorhinus torazame]|uniref:Uncharacterized protein n=1 Tax=Scyliorhinus torazame TaxID=75743 RepID=A0A401QBJ9_SCYTO|nr:hypothetical protein [Scyliorhinus torazame]
MLFSTCHKCLALLLLLSLNVDMEWLYGAGETGNMEVDIGYLPQMELRASGPSIPNIIVDENGNVIDGADASGEPIQFIFEEIVWQSEISFEEAVNRLETTMYPFKKVSYLPFTEAFDRAKMEDKLRNQEDEGTARLASLHLEHYNFPVEMIIALPNGTVIHHINANYFLDITSMKPEEESQLNETGPPLQREAARCLLMARFSTRTAVDGNF